MVTVNLSAAALAVIFRSTYELAHRIGNLPQTKGESVGNLYGARILREKDLEIRVDYAQPFQQIRARKPSSVDPYPQANDRMNWTMRGEKKVGDYHSHIWYTTSNGADGSIGRASAELSETDEKDIIDHPFTGGNYNGLVSVILALNKSARKTEMSITDKRISGTVKVNNGNNGTYHVTIAAYYFHKPNPRGRGRIRKAKLEVPRRIIERFFSYNSER